MRWAIVIGIDDYGNPELSLNASVSDALGFRNWVIDADGGGVPESNLWLLLSPRPSDEPAVEKPVPAATKDAIVTAINEVVVAAAKQPADRLYFYFAGHGITARVANRDESALVTPGFDELHTDHSLAVRSIAEYFETTAFADQFLFIDACRSIPWPDREFEVGRWPVPRRRDPGAEPVQQFILYATAPGRAAEERGWPDEAAGAFTGTLLEGLAGTENAKAWSWERNCYEVRWERLASFIHQRMADSAPPDVAEQNWRAQIPQDSGARGVAGRDRDVCVVSYPSGRFPHVKLTIELATDAKDTSAEVSVLDAIGEPIASALKVTGESQTFPLAPRTYAVRAITTAPTALFGSVKAPIELYRDRTVPIQLQPPGTPPTGDEVTERVGPEDIAAAGREQPPGSISIGSLDPLAVAEIVDEAGRLVAVKSAGEDVTVNPGFYHVRQLGPEASQDAMFVVLTAGEQETVTLQPPPPEPTVCALTEALGGSVEGNWVRMADGEEPMGWARPSTVVAAGIARTLQGHPPAGLGVADLRGTLAGGSGVAVFVIDPRTGGPAVDHVMADLTVRIWPAGEPVGNHSVPLHATGAGVASVVVPVSEPRPHWVSFATSRADPTVVALPVLPGRLATLIAQVGSNRIQLHQFHPATAGGPSSTVGELRRVEYLQRLLVSGRVDIAERLATQLARAASGDPFAGVVAGYLLLRLGRHDELDKLASEVIATAPTLADAYILRGEYEARNGRPEAADRAYANAINTGVPAFGEGLTRVLEGLRSGGYNHPRGALVRHIFQRHARGSMWAEFTPNRGLQSGRPVISAADLGFEA